MTTTTIDSKDGIQLNEFIFKEVSIYLVYNIDYRVKRINNNENNDNNKEKKNNIDNYKFKSPFQRLLEYALLSKNSFKIFQNIITSYQYNKINNFILPFNDFIKYIIKYNNNNKNQQQQQQYQLIQFKYIERLYFKNESSIDFPIANQLIESNGGSFDDKNYNGKRKHIGEGTGQVEVKEFLNSNCPNLKVCLSNENANYNIDYDYTCNGFYKIKNLYMHWDPEDPPISKGELSEVDRDEYDSYEYVHSFKFIGYYKPYKIHVSTCRDDMDLQLDNLDGILNCKSIKKMNFHTHITPDDFFKKVIDQNQVVSLTARLIGSYSSSIKEYSIIRIYDGVSANTSLRKLKLNLPPYHDYEIGWANETSLKHLINALKSNKTITSLGLTAFDVNDSSLLLPLLEIKNITTLYCFIKNLNVFIKHCNENQNITKLIVSNTNRCWGYGGHEEITDYDENEDGKKKKKQVEQITNKNLEIVYK